MFFFHKKTYGSVANSEAEEPLEFVKHMRQTVEIQENKINTLENEIQTLRSKISQQNQHIAEQNELIEDMKKNMQSKKKKNALIWTDWDDTTIVSEGDETEFNNILLQMKRLQQKCNELEINNTNLQKQNTELQKECQKLEQTAQVTTKYIL